MLGKSRYLDKRSYNSFPDAYYTLLEPQNWLKSFQDILDANSKVNFIQLVQVQKKVRFILRLWIEMIVVLLDIPRGSKEAGFEQFRNV
jgi:hypothetical protein